jgi:mono/diheme cytochrome c family protein
MKFRLTKYIHSSIPLKTTAAVGLILTGLIITVSSFKEEEHYIPPATFDSFDNDSAASVQAFQQVYKVLMSPRCMNCHPAGDRPLQGDDSHIHIMNVQRGKDGKGIYALKCSNCHQPQNVPGVHTPPGNPKWQLPPADMKLVFQGRSAHDLALQLMDYNRNGHKNKEQLLEHARDTLVKAGWNMGEGRTPPPMAYDDFVKAWDTWIEKGAYAPAK